jgi:MFS family permease
VISAGPALLLQEFGNLGTIFLSLPIALLLGLKREAVGACHSINRETNLALITDMFGPDSPEARGSLSIYVVGGMVGTIYFGFMVSVIAMLNIFHPYALGMASGVGAGIMMASATASLTEIYPTMANQISALASASETISGIDGIYMAIFVGIPLCNFLYRKLEPTLGKFADRRAEKRAAKKKGEA